MFLFPLIAKRLCFTSRVMTFVSCKRMFHKAWGRHLPDVLYSTSSLGGVRFKMLVQISYL